MSPTVVTFLFEAANFLVLAAVLGWLFFKPVRKAIADHRDKFEADNQQAAKLLAEAEVLRNEIREARQNLYSELNATRTRELATVKEQSDQMLSDARSIANREQEQSRLQASRMSDTQRDTLASAAAAAAADSVGKLLTQIESPDLQSSLIRFACQQLEKLSPESIAPVKVETSQTLSPDQRTAIQHALGASATGADFRIADDLGVGIRISTAKGLIDASASGLAEFARHSLTKEMHHRVNNHNPTQGVQDA